MAATAAAAVAMAVHHLLRPPPSYTSPSLCYLKPFLQRTLPTFFSPPPRLFCTPLASLTHLQIPSPLHSYDPVTPSEEEEEEYESDEPQNIESQEKEEEEGAVVRTGIPITAASAAAFLKVPNLSVKEKKELVAYAHGLGKKLKIQQVGKSGVTTSLATSFIETLEANEILKVL